MRGVHTGPGAMAFTRMPLVMRWGPKPLVKVVIAPCKFKQDAYRPRLITNHAAVRKHHLASYACVKGYKLMASSPAKGGHAD